MHIVRTLPVKLAPAPCGINISALHVGSPVLWRGFPETTSALPVCAGPEPGGAAASVGREAGGDRCLGGDRRRGGERDRRRDGDRLRDRDRERLLEEERRRDGLLLDRRRERSLEEEELSRAINTHTVAPSQN
mmetsp:Transcript_58145/g.107052  ORF Transcript_58145/g.107052 Transcript_58145/m.107052 type:complete len:133 (+) Transcript_58145:168-566(+)